MENWKSRFFTIWAGQAASLFGSSLVQFALVWWLTVTTGSATVLATATLAGMLPQILLSPFAGVVVDRASRRLIMVVADSLTALFTLLLAVLFAAGQAQAWHIYAIMFIRSATGAFHFPAMQASTSLMVPEQHLSRVAGMNSTLQGLMSIAAPALGALLVSLMPMQHVMLIDVGTAAIATLPLLFIAIPQPKRGRSALGAEASKPSFMADLREGVRYVLTWRGLTIMLGMAMLANFMLTPAGSLTPILVTKHFGGGAPQLALMEAMWGIGTIAGGLLLSVWGGFKRRIVTTLFGLMLLGSSFAGMGVTPSGIFVSVLVFAALAGLANPITNGPMFAVMQATIAPDKQGRVMALTGALSTAVTPLSLLVAGPIADVIGVQAWYLAAGVTCLVLGVAGFFIPALANIETEMRQQAGLATETATSQPAIAAASK